MRTDAYIAAEAPGLLVGSLGFILHFVNLPWVITQDATEGMHMLGESKQ